MQGSRNMKRASAQWDLCLDRRCPVKRRTALQGDGFPTAVRSPMIEYLALVGFWQEHQAARVLIHVPQRNPDSHLVIIELRIPEGLILVPGGCFTAPSALENRQIENKGSSLPQYLSCDALRIGETLGLMQLRGVVYGKKDLWRVWLIIIVVAGGQFSIGSFLPPGLFPEQPF